MVDLHRREQYAKAQLLESDVAADPLLQLQRWLDDAEAAQVAEPNAMVVVTVDASGRPRPPLPTLRDTPLRPRSRAILMRRQGSSAFSQRCRAMRNSKRRMSKVRRLKGRCAWILRPMVCFRLMARHSCGST
jgi:hypothetical protein